MHNSNDGCKENPFILFTHHRYLLIHPPSMPQLQHRDEQIAQLQALFSQVHQGREQVRTHITHEHACM